MSQKLFEINPTLERSELAARFARDGRVQVRDVLTAETATTIRGILQRETPWGFAYKVDGKPAVMMRQAALRTSTPDHRRDIATDIHRTAAAGGYGVRFNQYPILDAYLERWAPDGPHDLLLEYINAEPFLKLVREITGIAELIKADAQATCFAPGDFLSIHNDSHVAEGWQVAYVLNLADPEWKPDWGGYLNFFDDDGDIVQGWRPRFNALNLLRVPQLHNVSYVPPFAPMGRFAITGWFRDR